VSLGEPTVRRALAWILDRLQEDPGQPRGLLVDRAAREFDLTPLQAEFLLRQLRPVQPGSPPK
jgi:hypothetical protein